MAAPRICSIDGCDKIVKAKGWCNAHHKRWQRHGDPLGGGTAQGEPLKFLLALNPDEIGSDCVPWPYARLPNGYGHLWVDGIDTLASRYVCERFNGPSPSPKDEAAHSCGNGHEACINPHHILWKTRAGNEADKLNHATHRRGERNEGAILKEDDVRKIRSMKGQMTGRELGELYHTTRWAIYSIWSRKSWAWLSD